jgi:hypothetical protein
MIHASRIVSNGLKKYPMSFEKLFRCLLVVLLFILPWQTRFIYEQAFINGAPWEYGTKSLYGTELLLGLLIFCGIILLVRQKKFWSAQVRKSTYWLSVAVLSGLVACVIAGSVRPDISFDFFTRLLLCASLMVLIAARVVPITRYQVLAAFWLGGVLQGALALHQFFTQQVFANKWLGMAGHSAQELGASVVEFGGERWLRAYGSFGSPNSLGIYLAVIVVLGIILYAGSDSRKIKLGITVGQRPLPLFSDWGEYKWGRELRLNRGSRPGPPPSAPQTGPESSSPPPASVSVSSMSPFN